MGEDTEQDTESNSRSTAWLSEGFEVLAKGLGPVHQKAPKHVDFDVVVVGSGYGGAVAAKAFAETLKGRKWEGKKGGVCVLERGREYLNGMFPKDVGELPEHVRFSGGKGGITGQRAGLFDLHLSEDVLALVASGVGGGSLINAGVIAKADFCVLDRDPWPKALRSEAERRIWDQWCDRASKALGAEPAKSPTYGGKRRLIMSALRRGRVEDPALSIAVEGKRNASGVALEPCARCGDCVTGCNYGAKESLDTNLLVEAKRNGARIVSGATVEKLERSDHGWLLHVNYTDAKLRRRQKNTLALFAKHVVLAAGVFGSTEILLRSESKKLRFSGRLGHRFSGNGDTLATVVGLEKEADAVADENVAPASRDIGPTIASIFRPDRVTDIDNQFVVQDLAVPAALRRIFQEATALSTGFDDLSRTDKSRHGPADRDPCSVDQEATNKTLLIAMMGHDSANGRIALVPTCPDGEGGATVIWPEARDDRRLEARHRALEELFGSGSKDKGNDKDKDKDKRPRVLANPLWRIFPPEMGFLFENTRGPVLTTHPLGGCPMGDDVEAGVVDHHGRLFDAACDADAAVHPGLAVLDGSIVPTSLGINPALTITALAMRATAALTKEWFPDSGEPKVERPHEPLENRPVFRKLRPDAPPPVHAPTQIEVLERLDGTAQAPWFPGRTFAFDVTLQFKPIAVERLLSPDPDDRCLEVDPEHSKLRLFDRTYWIDSKKAANEERPDEKAFLIAPITSGSLRLFPREQSTKGSRQRRALWAWFTNRGMRDTWQHLWDRPRAKSSPPVKGVFALSSLAGEARLLEYTLTLGHPVRDGKGKRTPTDGVELKATKRLTYGRRSNPWTQLLTASWSGGPMRGAGEGDDLTVDLRYLEHRRIPLFRVLEQTDQVRALLDVIALLLYVLRVVLRVHTWSFRKPDARPRKAPAPNRLPSAPEGMRIRRIYNIQMAKAADAPEAEPLASIRLTRFQAKEQPKAKGQLDATARKERPTPVLMIHGYSTSGTTYAHHTVPSLAKELWRNGFEPWVLDMRTSAGLDTARYPWSFEQVGYADIPVAIEAIRAQTGKQVHVVAHCMGAAMTCMALLGDLPEETGPSSPFPAQYEPPDPYPVLRKAMRTQVASLVLSQVTPFTLYTPTNMLRSLLLRYFRPYVSQSDFSFRVDSPASLGDQLLDRLLSTMPYPKNEFDCENPPVWQWWKRTPWTATRHRMDALYGQDFSVRHLTGEVLDHIDDLFGPLSMGTVSQGIHLARRRTLTDYMGVNRFVTHERLIERLRMPVLSLHGDENGLVDVSTAHYMNELFSKMADGVKRTAVVLPGFGHQDTLIGKGAEEHVFPKIVAFLRQPKSEPECPQPRRVRVELPELGIGLGKVTQDELTVFIDNRMHHKDVDAIGAVPVRARVANAPAPLGGRRTYETSGDVRLVWRRDSEVVAYPKRRPGEISVPHALWAGADGVLFVQLTGPLDSKEDIDAGIRSILALANAERCVVPNRAIASVPEDASRLCFALGSCQYPAGLIDGTPHFDDVVVAPGPADKSYARLAERLRSSNGADAPNFLIMAGDNVYVDATAGLADPSVRDGRYFTPYEQLFSSAFLQDITRQIPVCAMLDDHELYDNWEDERSVLAREAFEHGRQSYIDYLRTGSLLDTNAFKKEKKLCAAFTRGGFEFFAADTRTDRDRREAQGVYTKDEIISEPQKDALKDWLKATQSSSADPKVRNRPRFIITASSVFPRRLATRKRQGALQSDAWDGYPVSLNWLFDVIETGGHRNLVFLSGDEHRCITATARLAGTEDFLIHSIHSSGMYTPYPFANSIPEHFAEVDTLPFRCEGNPSRKYTWKYEATFAPPGQGFAVIALAYDGARQRWGMTVTFDLDGRGALHPPQRFTFPPVNR
jgi:cholesterol oxidase